MHIPLSNIKHKAKNKQNNAQKSQSTPKTKINNPNNNTTTNHNQKQPKPHTKTNSTHKEFRLYGSTTKKNVSDPTAVEFLFLGTGAANPTPRRCCSGLLLRIADEAILFDCGEGIAYNAQKLRENLSDLKTIILTHNHGDHLFGLPTFLRYYWDKYPNNKLKIIGTAPVAEWIYHSFEICELSKYYPNFSVEELSYPIQNLTPPLPFPVNSLVPDSGQNTWLCMDTPAYKILSCQIIHSITCYGYFIYEKSSKKKILILGDTSNPKAALKLASNVDVLIHECTYPDDRITRARQNGHSTPKLISQFVNLIGAKHLIVNHVGARFDNQVEELRNLRDVIEKATNTPTVITSDLDRFVLA